MAPHAPPPRAAPSANAPAFCGLWPGPRRATAVLFDTLTEHQRALSLANTALAHTTLLDWLVGLALGAMRLVFSAHVAQDYDPERDSLEQQLIRHALYHDLPVLGIREAAVTTGLTRADALITIGAPDAQAAFDTTIPKDLPRFQAELRPLQTGMDWSGGSYIAFAGIGQPQKFFDTLIYDSVGHCEKGPIWKR